MKAIKKVNKNGTFRFELENGDVIVKSTKRDYNAFVVLYKDNSRIKESYIDGKSSRKGFTLCKYSSTTKGVDVALELALNSGYKIDGYFTATV